MYGILGNASSAKFIFFAMDDVNRDLDRNAVKRLLGCKTANVYKANGRYRESFYEINQLLNMRTKGVNLHDRHHMSSEKYLTHAVRVDDTCKFNSLLALQYWGLIASWLVLDVSSLGRLTALLESIEIFRGDYFLAKSLNAYLLQCLKYTKELEFLTLDKVVPSDEDINQIFEHYGERELTTINTEISNWFDAARWDTILEEESIAA
jgi:hypothetical protein